MNTPEYLAFRCCMCPNIGTPESSICPPSPALHPEESPCRFVKKYIDDKGQRYFVRSGIGGDTFKAFFLKPGKTSPHGLKMVPWQDSFDKAQADLNKYAEKKAWKEC